MDIDKLEAGREIDKKVHLIVSKNTFYFPINQDPEYLYQVVPDGSGYIKVYPPPYSTDIAAAWLVVEKMQELGYPVLRLSSGDSLGDKWQFHCSDAWRQVSHEEDKDFFANADTAPLAICRAALKALDRK